MRDVLTRMGVGLFVGLFCEMLHIDPWLAFFAGWASAAIMYTWLPVGATNSDEKGV